MRIITRFNQNLPLSAETIGYNWPQPIVERPSGYPFYHWLQSERGRGVIEIAHVKYELKEGDGILLSPRLPHRYYPSNNIRWETAFLTFGGALADELVHFIFPNKYVYVKRMSQPLTEFIQKNFVSFLSDNYVATVKQSALIYQFLLMLDSVTQVSSNSSKDEVIDPMMAYIKTHYAEKITNQSLERVTNFSSSYGNRAFKEHFGLTPQQYLMDFRLRKAKELLISAPGLQIQDVAMQAGFNDVSYFIKEFRKINKMTPNQFRNHQK